MEWNLISGSIILAALPNVCFRQRCTHLVRQPAVSVLPGHAAGFIELVEIVVGCTPQSTQFVVCQTPHRLSRAGVGADICVALWVPAAHIEHGAIVVFLINSIRAAEHHWTAAIWAAHLLFLFMLFHGQTPLYGNKKAGSPQRTGCHLDSK